VTPEGDQATIPMGLFGLGLTVRAMGSGTACQVELTAWEKKRVPDASRRRSWKLTSLKAVTARETLVLVLLVALEQCASASGSSVQSPSVLQSTGNSGIDHGGARRSHQWTYLSTAAMCAKRIRMNERKEWTPPYGVLTGSMLKRSILLNE
jgi:hypothetical protein